MEKKFSIWRTIDEFIFKQVDVFKASTSYQKMLDALSLLQEHQQKLVGQSLAIGLALMPFFVAFIIFLGNQSAKEEIEIKRKIISEINALKSQTSYFNNIGEQVVAKYPLESKAALERRLLTLIQSIGMDPSIIQVASFENTASIGEYQETTALLQFNRINTEQLVQLLQEMLIRESLKISAMTIRKNENSLNGSINIVHLGK